MKPTKAGQVVKFTENFPDEDPNQLYVVVEIADDKDAYRAAISPIGFKFRFPPINLVSIADLEIVSLAATEMIGETVTLRTEEGTEVSGRVVSCKDEFVNLEMSMDGSGVVTNCRLEIIDGSGLALEGFYVYKA